MIEFPTGFETVHQLEFAPDGLSLYALGAGEVRSFRVPSGERVGTHPLHTACSTMAISPDGRYLATGGGEYVLRDRVERTVVLRARPRSVENPFLSVFFDPESQRAFALGEAVEYFDLSYPPLAEARWSRSIRSFDVQKRIRMFGQGCHHPSEPVLAVVLRTWQPSGWALELVEYGPGEVDPVGSPRRLWWRDDEEGNARSPTFSPDGRRLAANVGKRLVVWDTETAATLFRSEPDETVADFVFSVDGRYLAYVGGHSGVRTVGTGDWSRVGDFDWATGPLSCIATTTDGCLMAVADEHGSVVLWDHVE